MRKLLLILLAVIFLLITVSCSSEQEGISVPMSKVNYSTELDINSPEGLAKASGTVYKKLSRQEISIDKAIEELTGYASKESRKEIEVRADAFKKGIQDFIDYMKGGNDFINEINYAQTVYTTPDEAYIQRVQKHKNGKKYYFQQDFVRQEGQWKISGDNMADPFTLKRN